MGNLVGAAYAALHFGGEVYFESCLFLKNLNYAEKSIFGGSAIVIYGIFAIRIYSNNCTFTENYSFGRGGAVLLLAGQFYDNFSSYLNNSGNIGGAIYVWIFNSLMISNILSFNNSALTGGMIYASSAILQISKSTFKSNFAQNGAVVFFEGAQQIFLVIFLNLKK